jgi:hypothetical protein
MNMKKLSLSALIVTGLMVSSISMHVRAAENYLKPSKYGVALFLTALAIQYRLDTKESEKDPAQKYKWKDLYTKDVFKIVDILDEKFIGQKAKGSSIKLTVGDKEIKETSKAPATGICGNGHQILTNFGKASFDLFKVFIAPVILVAIRAGAFTLTTKDGVLQPGFDTKKLMQEFSFFFVKDHDHYNNA